MPDTPPLIAPLPRKLIAWVATAIAAATAGVVVWLWLADPSQARLDALRTGLSIGLGGGGLFALYLAWRRQHSTEIALVQKQQDQELQRETALATQHDAEARRVTDLYTKAVEQLGSDKAPVRLGGLYALERLAQDHVEQRQTIVNVLCAYLRMPYTVPGDPPEDEEKLAGHRGLLQEREVRLTAQRILRNHLVPGDDPDTPLPTFWRDIDLDLTNATLISFGLAGCRIRTARFSDATFIGTTRFDDAMIAGTAHLSRATFTGIARFSGAGFGGTTWFNDASFAGAARFNGVGFAGPAWFGGARFAGPAWFDEARVTATVSFAVTRFATIARFDGATFTGIAWFGEVGFAGAALFNGVRFRGDVDFGKAYFAEHAEFDRVALPRARRVDSSTPSPWTDFGGARFEHGVPSELESYVSGA
ncbi:pentapeptide repeat-containing protein [Actinokineospora auranticolor]|uniref:pentapeptide repeat-containing protein n=1 Tax=Actinokineospora auranticolor TaxID=155976 RepID=UPI0015E3DFCC|nr:pentapeptide repeat-containing protein [Actinokineospora auranticolor]